MFFLAPSQQYISTKDYTTTIQDYTIHLAVFANMQKNLHKQIYKKHIA